MRSQPIALVFCRFGTPKMLPQTKWYGGLGEPRRCMHEMAPLRKVNIFFKISGREKTHTTWTNKKKSFIFYFILCDFLYLTAAAYSNRHSHCFGPVLVWLDWKTLNWKVSNRIHVSGDCWCLVRTVWSMLSSYWTCLLPWCPIRMPWLT